MAAAAFARSQTTRSSATTTATSDGRMDYGAEGMVFPPAVVVSGHTPRTAQLLGEAYRRNDPVVAVRVQYVAELGQTARAEAAPFLGDAMKDQSAAVRAEAARSAAMVNDAAFLPKVEQLLGDADASVRREAVLATAALARAAGKSTDAVQRGLDDKQPQVIAAALRSASTPEDAKLVATKLPSLASDLQCEAALILARIGARDQSSAILALLHGDARQRIVAAQALGALGDPAQADAVMKLLADPHPSVRREAVAAMARLADAPTRQARAVQMLADPDPTVRRAVAIALTPLPSTDALKAVAGQLDEDNPPLHQAVRDALSHPADATVRDATIRAAVELLGSPDPRRREDASYVLGRLRSDAAIDAHLALLHWDPQNPTKTEWPVVAQAAESLGLIGDRRAIEPLMSLVAAAPDAIATVPQAQRDAMSMSMSNALIAVARLGHKPAMREAARVLKIDPQTGNAPAPLRAAAAFAVGALADAGKLPPNVNLLGVYESTYESRATKFEALKALGNIRHAASAERLKPIAENEPSPDLRWIAHWAYDRINGTESPYTPPTDRREPPVSVTDLPR